MIYIKFGVRVRVIACCQRHEGAWKQDLVIKMRRPSPEQLEAVGNRSFLGMLSPQQNPELKAQLAGQGATAFSMDMLLRTCPGPQSRGATCARTW